MSVFYLKKSQIDNIREVLQSFAEVIRSFEEQLDLVEANQQLEGTESDSTSDDLTGAPINTPSEQEATGILDNSASCSPQEK